MQDFMKFTFIFKSNVKFMLVSWNSHSFWNHIMRFMWISWNSLSCLKPKHEIQVDFVKFTFFGDPKSEIYVTCVKFKSQNVNFMLYYAQTWISPKLCPFRREFHFTCVYNSFTKFWRHINCSMYMSDQDMKVQGHNLKKPGLYCSWKATKDKMSHEDLDDIVAHNCTGWNVETAGLWLHDTCHTYCHMQSKKKHEHCLLGCGFLFYPERPLCSQQAFGQPKTPSMPLSSDSSPMSWNLRPASDSIGGLFCRLGCQHV